MKIHFIGIGGIGISALAQYYLEKGHKISGSDLSSSEITDWLKEKGAKLLIGKHRTENLPKNIDLVVYSPAVLDTNPELKGAKKLGIKCQSYPQALGELTKSYFTIAVSGTHGKSTTTAMISLILEKAGFDPTVVIGTKLKEFGGNNFRTGHPVKSPYGDHGTKEYLVIEADEWHASFLNYWPKVIVLTNIEREHLDYYKNLENILRTFRDYISHLPRKGLLVANAEDENIFKILPSVETYKIERYSLKQREAGKIKKTLQVPGKHNVSNALAALAVARFLGVPDEVSFKALSGFKGTWRRFEIKKGIIDSKHFTVISDYGHHPTEIKATLAAAREKFPSKKIWCIFQPHQYQRTYYLFDDFVKVFLESSLDKIIITDIYDVAGREKMGIKRKVSSKKLIKKINKKTAIYPHTKRGQGTFSAKINKVRPRSGVGVYLPKEKIKNYLRKNLCGGEVVVIMGAGDIYKLDEEFCR